MCADTPVGGLQLQPGVFSWKLQRSSFSHSAQADYCLWYILGARLNEKMPIFKHLQTWKPQFIGEDAYSIGLLRTPTEDLQIRFPRVKPIPSTWTILKQKFYKYMYS